MNLEGMQAVYCLLMIWWHQGPQTREQAKEATLRKVIARLEAAQSLSGTVDEISTTGGIRSVSRMTFSLKKPNLERITSKDGDGGDYISDGKHVYIVMRPLGTCGISDADPHGLGLPPGFLGLSLFFDRNALSSSLWTSAPIKYQGVEQVGKFKCSVIKVGPAPARPYLSDTLYIGPNDQIVREVSSTTSPDGKISRIEFRYTYNQPSVQTSKADFKFTPPPDLKIYDHRANQKH